MDGEGADAIEALRTLVREHPDDADAHGRLGTWLLEHARRVQLAALARRRRADAAARALYGEALVHFQAALRLQPHKPQAARLCGHTQRELGDLEGARESLTSAWRLDPHDARTAADYAAVLTALGAPHTAIGILEQALKAHPGDPALHGELALVLLGSGTFARGWDEYEWRLQLPDAATARPMPWPRWRGEPLGGRTLLVTSEQGIGDEIMFASCFNDLLANARHCIFEVSTRLASVFARSFPSASIVTRSMARAPAVPAHAKVDCWTPAGSVPRVLRRSRADFPRQAGYLHADPGRVRNWAARLADSGRGRKIGLAWTGGLPGTMRASRSLALEQLRPLLAGSDTFIALEFNECADEVAAFNAAGDERILCWPDAVATLEENAAIVSALDLVISVPTATAHMAGALGQPVWVLVPALATWRYLWEGERVPWYPSMRVVRGLGQGCAGVVRRVRAALDGAA